MKSYTFLVSLALLVNSQIALSKTTQEPDQTKNDNTNQPKSSKENRKQITANFGTELSYGYNFVAGYHFLPDLIAEIWFEKDLQGTSGCRRFDIQNTNYFGIRSRYFFGNSFNISAFSYYVRSKYNCVSFTWADGPKEPYEILRNQNYASLGAGFSLGNRWQWDNFYLGGEWIGLGIEKVVKKYSTKEPPLSGKVIISRLTFGISL